MSEVRVCDSASVPPASMRSFVVNGTAIVIVRMPDGTLRSYLDRCSHADVKLSKGSFDGSIITCRAHGATFDGDTGAARSMPAVTPIRRLLVTEQAEAIFVELP